jgi:thymidine kinase
MHLVLLLCCLLLAVVHLEAMQSAAPLHFRHGAVSSAKSLNLLAVAHSYKVQGKTALVMKPSIDIRFGTDEVRSRAGLSQKADFVLKKHTNVLNLPLPESPVHCVLVDEAQFLQVDQVDQLRLATEHWKIPIFCYGLRTDFRSHLFPGSKRLMEVADVIEEIPTCCHYCTNKAILNLKHVNGVADSTGPTVQLGAEEKYYPTCFECYRRSLTEVHQSPVESWNHHVMRKSVNTNMTPKRIRSQEKESV